MTRNTRKKYTNTLGDIHIHRKTCPSIQKKKNSRSLKKKREDKQRWKSCPAATISSVTWWVFSFKQVRSSAPQWHYLGICHSHIKLLSANLFSHRTCCQMQKHHCFLALSIEGWGWERGCETEKTKTKPKAKDISKGTHCVHKRPALQSITWYFKELSFSLALSLVRNLLSSLSVLVFSESKHPYQKWRPVHSLCTVTPIGSEQKTSCWCAAEIVYLFVQFIPLLKIGSSEKMGIILDSFPTTNSGESINGELTWV